MNFLASFTVLKLRNLGFETVKSVRETFFSTITFLTKYIQPMTTDAIFHVYFKPLLIFTASFSHCVRMFLKRATTVLEFYYIGIKYSCWGMAVVRVGVFYSCVDYFDQSLMVTYLVDQSHRVDPVVLKVQLDPWVRGIRPLLGLQEIQGIHFPLSGKLCTF